MPEILEKKDEVVVIHLGELAEKVAKLGVAGMKKLIEELRKHDREKFKRALREAGIEVIEV